MNRTISNCILITGAVRRGLVTLYAFASLSLASAQVCPAAYGITHLFGTRYENQDGAAWAISSNVVSCAGTRLYSEHREQLSGMPSDVKSRIVDVDVHGAVTTNTVVRRADDAVEEIIECPVRPSVRRGLGYGLTLYEEEQGEGIQYSYDFSGRIGMIEKYIPPNIDEMLTVENRIYTRFGDLAFSEKFIGTDNGKLTTFYRYDFFGNRVLASNTVGNVEVASYDVFGRITRIDGVATPARFVYDTAGRMTEMRTTRNGVDWDVTRWIYDPATGLCLSKIFNDGSHCDMQYTPDGLLSHVSLTNGEWREYEYDAFRHLCAARYSSGSTTAFERTNNPLGMILSVSDSKGRTVSRSYNGRGSLVSEETHSSSTNVVVRHLDGYDRVVGIHHSRNLEMCGTICYSYAADGCLEGITITNGANRCLSIAYSNVAGRVMATDYVTCDGRIKEKVRRDRYRPELVSVREWLFNDNALCLVSNKFDEAGRTIAVDGNQFRYDFRNQFVAGIVEGNACSNVYDNAGNITSIVAGDYIRAFTHNSLNQIATSIETGCTNSFGYDGEGNLVSDGKWCYSWDGEGRLLSAVPSSPISGSLSVENEYDYAGRRVLKRVKTFQSGTWEDSYVSEMTYDGCNIIHERRRRPDGTTVCIEYYWGAAPTDRRVVCGGSGGLVAVSVDGVFYIPKYDESMNVVGFWNENGGIAARRVFSPTGFLLLDFGDVSSAIPIGFGTKYTDRETGLVNYEARCYSPLTGRWLSRDPMAESGGRNLYCFVNNRFVYCYDTSGMFSWTTIAVALIEGVGLVIDRTQISKFIDDAIIDAYGGPEGFMDATEQELSAKGGALPKSMFAKARAHNSNAIDSKATGLEGNLYKQLQSSLKGSPLYAQKKNFIIMRLKQGTAHNGFVNIDFQDAGEDTLGYAIGGAQLHYKYNKRTCTVEFFLKDSYDFTNKGHMWGRLEKKGYLVTYPVEVKIEEVKVQGVK